MITRITLAVLVALISIPATGLAERIELAPSQDAHVRSYTPDDNYGSGTNLYVGKTTFPDNEYRSYIQFDLAGIPPDATIDAAYLYLYQPPGSCTGSDLTVHKVLSGWQETEITWNNKPSNSSSIAKRIEPPNPCEWFVIPLRSLVRQWHAGTLSNHGIVLRHLDILVEPGRRTFKTRESSYPPKLVIVYNSQSLLLTPEKDAHVSETEPGTNYGSSDEMRVRGTTGTSSRSYLGFDISGIPEDATIDFARLRLRHYLEIPISMPGGDRAGAYRVTTPWDEGSITWATKPTNGTSAFSLKGGYGGGYYTGWMDWDVTNLVDRWFNGTNPNYGVVVKHPTENLSLGSTGLFFSREYSNPDYHPQLEVFYSIPPPNDFSNYTDLRGVYGSDAQWGDFDGDGDLDLVMSGITDAGIETITYRNNEGTLVEYSNSIVGVACSGSGALALGDYDNDGDLDLAVTGGSTGVSVARIYNNSGDGTFTWDEDQELIDVNNSSAAWGDYDNDGDIDLFVQGTPGPIKVATLYINDPTGTLKADTLLGLTGLEAGSVDWGDFDGDGDLDLLRTGTDGLTLRTILCRNHPRGTLSEDETHGLPGDHYSDVACGDFDRNGSLDVAIVGGGSPAIAQIYANDGSGHFVQVWDGSLDLQQSSCAWGDFDNDGRLDVAFSGYDNPVGHYTHIVRCTESNTFDAVASIVGAEEGSVSWADVDDDADLDLLVTGFDGGSYIARLHWNENGVANTQPSPPTSFACSQDYPMGPPMPGTLHIVWSGASDDETTLNGLYYCVRVGTEWGGDDVFSGTYGSPLMGNVGQANHLEITVPSPDRPYYWSVKSIDTGLMASEWSTQQCSWGEIDVGTNEIDSVDDAFVDSGTPAATHGNNENSEILAVGDWGGFNNTARTYIKFYLPGSTPPHCTVESAQLYLYCIDVIPGPYRIASYDQGDDSWSENTITWYNAPKCFDPWPTDVVSVSGTGWYAWDVTSAVGATVDNNLTVVLRGHNPPEGTPDYRAEFWSDEGPDPAKHPYLVVTYSTITGVGDPPGPERFSLGQNSPNPFNPDTRIEYSIPSGAANDRLVLKIYDVRGRLVRSLVDAPQPPGVYAVRWDGRDDAGSNAASGVYFYRIDWAGKSEARKMVLIR